MGAAQRAPRLKGYSTGATFPERRQFEAAEEVERRQRKKSPRTNLGAKGLMNEGKKIVADGAGGQSR
jgi:hypothetical protein